MKQKIGCLIKEKLLIMILGFDHQFYRFFPYLLRYLIDSLVKKPRHIRFIRSGFPTPAFNDLLEADQEILPVILLIPAGIRTGMTNRPQRLRFDQRSLLPKEGYRFPLLWSTRPYATG